MKTMKSNDSYSIILFDGDCNFCNQFVNFVIDHDPERKYKFTSLRSEVAQQILPPLILQSLVDKDTIVLIENGVTWIRSDAIIRIGLRLNWNLVRVCCFVLGMLPRLARDAGYRLFANYRHLLLSANPTCRIPSEEMKNRFL